MVVDDGGFGAETPEPDQRSRLDAAMPPATPAPPEHARQDSEALPPSLGGRYELRSVLGEGGMASVYLGYDTSLRTFRAVKVLAPHVAKPLKSHEWFF